MKIDVEYCIESNLRSEIIKVKNVCMEILNNPEVYLFGSISKGMYKKNSDIDILILISENKDLKELRNLRHSLEDKIEVLKLNRDVDIKLYNKDRYIELTRDISFEQAIYKDLIDIRMW